MVSRRQDGANARRKAAHAKAPDPRTTRARTGSASAPAAPGRPIPRSGRPGWGAGGEQASWSAGAGHAGWDGDGGRANWPADPGQPGWSADEGGSADVGAYGWSADVGRSGGSANGGHAGWAQHGADHPSRPANDAGPGWDAFADHPSWPANDASPGPARYGGDHPSWPANAVDASWTQYEADHPSRSMNDPNPGWTQYGADHPSWPAADASPGPAQYGADHRSWPANAVDASWPYPGTDHQSWTANTPGTGVAPAHGGATGPRDEPPGGLHHDQRWQATGQHTIAQPAQGRATTAAYQITPPMGAHAKGQRWSAQFARAQDQDTTTQTYYELAFGDGRLQVMLTEPPTDGRGWAAGGHARTMEALPAGGQQTGAVAWETEDLRNSDSVHVAARILSDADYQAAEIRRAAAEQTAALREAAEAEAAEIRQQAAAQTAPLREGAELEAAQIKEQAAARAAAIREAAEHEAAAIRAAAQQDADSLRSAILNMSADLDRMAAYITENFTGPIERITGDVGTSSVAYTEPAGDYARPATPEPAGPGAWAPAATPVADPAPAPAVGPYEALSDEEWAESLKEASPGTRATGRAMPVTTPAGPAIKPVRPTEKPGRSRQYRTMRLFTGTIATLVVVAVATGAYQLATHGYTFFVFRSAGTGATDNNAVFPGIIPTPTPSPAHQQPSQGRHARGAHQHHPGKGHRKHPGGTHHVKGH